MVTVFAVCCMSVRAEVSGDRGGPPAADEAADQRLLSLHRGHPRSSRSGMCWPGPNGLRLSAPFEMKASLVPTLVKCFVSLNLHVCKFSGFFLRYLVAFCIRLRPKSFRHFSFGMLILVTFCYNRGYLEIKQN